MHHPRSTGMFSHITTNMHEIYCAIIRSLSMSFSKRLKAIIKEERYSQKAFAKTVGIPLRTLEDYLAGRTEPGLQAVTKIVGHPIFKKYALWLICSDNSPNPIQTCPSSSTQEQCGLLVKNTTKQV